VQGSPPERRASARSTEKKTGLILFGATSSACPFAAVYEELRNGALTGVSTGSHFGLVVLLREGIAAWIASTSTRPATPTTAGVKERPAPRAAALLVGDAIRADIVAVLANMVMAIPEEKCA
jgi:hypothetical protein